MSDNQNISKRLLTETQGVAIKNAIAGISQSQAALITSIATAESSVQTNLTQAQTAASDAQAAAGNAQGSAAAAAISATNAETSATNANSYKSAAQAAQTAAEVAQDAAEEAQAAAEAAAAEAAEYYFVPLTDQEIINIFEEAGYIIPTEAADVMLYKGSVATYDALPTTVTPGWVYNVTDTGSNYVWTGTAWDDLAGELDYATTSDVDDVVNDIP